ncbi:(2Fe-2S)-binding protein [Oleiphilus sp. HI0071]|uniref:(2Fe-2S)-binding protein n=1 Tax=unclassified Oleiphilus TaxID=2631174 RepID=UPI0007C21A96|nr:MULTISPECIES: (2Fe-2S)-binding protein [unclassified Oleiphilus]KZY62188.1 (2Fe-2S)-binding protein [Oleiphilus sp. HI0065]KZY82162.1 (2Fe-2S)-binding protein [Oleiphilus sp. HI0071]KZZ00812.1 (2Fe-2S)-binding protein [Oleiphilus sp. HI0073]KZZ42813.1 (2Fe-2S)-binding protein [Oleiphilus sp. HI0118]KZZ48272.1 (2Fe-2S)-binding protein [Oleiphilus sp. HI0122]KZZ71276.1 (2Fe-2S)-binding protein [Oleiphilus sp. HI0130]KZZ79330.1 (2Fe-2S)-binding protein [Oleiphilus sp. HI0133]
MKFVLNGEDISIDIDPDMPLLWAIRDEIGKKGTKFGCGMGLCGACTVHLNGQAIRSCITPIGSIEGQNITTIEGLGERDNLHPVQQAWIEHNVPQCGYCQPGQIMSATALLSDNASPSDDDIDSAMSGNICRCGTYPRIRKAIKSAAVSIANADALAYEAKV